MHRPHPAAIFGTAVLLRALFVAWVGQPGPKGAGADENVYLELAWNLWTLGEYGSRVSVTYPPVFPLFAAPFFALPTNALRFAGIYFAQALVAGLATVAAFPALRSLVGRERAWQSLALLQLFAGVTYSARTTQSETLFAAFFVAATGCVWLCWDRLPVRGAILVGLCAGLGITTRRTALVLPVAFGLLLAQDLWEGRRAALGPTLRRGLGFTVGGLLGYVPELLAGSLHGGAIQPYADGAAVRHLSAGPAAFASFSHLGLAIQVGARQLAYLVAATFAAPLTIAALLLDPRARRLGPAPVPLTRMASFAGWSALGLAAMTALHILRYSFSVRSGRGWDVYPRYLDPAEIPLVIAAFALAAWWWRKDGDGARPSEAVSLLRPWVIGCAVLVAVSGALRRPRGGRLSWVTDLLDSPVAPVAPWLFVAGTLLMLTIYLRWAWGRGGVAQARGLVAGAAVSWLLCVHVPVIWLTRGLGEGEVPAVLRSHALRARPRAPLGVVVPQVSPFSRPYYEAAFRSDHLVWFLRPEEAPAWAQAHPDGFLLTRKSDPHPEAAPVARAGPWQIWEPATWGPAPRDPAATGKAQ